MTAVLRNSRLLGLVPQGIQGVKWFIPVVFKDLGNSNSEAKHSLILDREKHAVYIAPVKAAEVFLKQQWPPERTRMSQQEYQAQYALVEEMKQWLDTYLKK
jgi:hypothetical protein